MKSALTVTMAMACFLFAPVASAQFGLYGLTSKGGKFDVGTVFHSDTAGTFTVEHDLFRFDGGGPQGDVIEASDGNIYGMCLAGGDNTFGIIFTYNRTTGGFKTIHSMDPATGSVPFGGLIEATPGVLYGMTSEGGASSMGVIFSFEIATLTYTVLHEFSGLDGQQPWGSLEEENGILYGMTRFGGTSNFGVLFQYDIVGATYTKLFDFSLNKGRYPLGELNFLNGELWGTTLSGGTAGGGVLFSFDPNTTTQNIKHHFDNVSGRLPFRGVIQAADGYMYGMTSSGGAANTGSIYRYDTDLDTLFNIHDFSIADGRTPLGILLENTDGELYGLTQFSGVFNGGTIFSIDPTTEVFTKYVDMTATTGIQTWGGFIAASDAKLYTMTSRGGESNSGVLGCFDTSTEDWTRLLAFNTSDGAQPSSRMVLASDGFLYGMAPIGGDFNLGVIFQYDQNTSTYTLKHSFDQLEGSFPLGALTEGPDGKLYGMTSSGGNDGIGILFSYDPVSEVFVKLIDMTVANGSEPNGSLTLASNGLFYGMTRKGGSNNGVVFSYNHSTNTFTRLFSLTASTGQRPEGDLVEAPDGKLYGLTSTAGANLAGTIIAWDIAGGTLSKVFDFDPFIGSEPTGSMTVFNDSLLFGMTNDGGGSLAGTIFSWNINSNTHDIVHDFNGTNGENPEGGLTLSSTGAFYGMTITGGSNDKGVVFKYRPATDNYTVLRHLDDADGIFPLGELTLLEQAGTKLAIDVMLEGPYNSPSNQMDDDLRAAGLIPLTEPFTGLGFTHVGDGGGESIDANILTPTGNDAIVDWVFVELRDKNDNTNVLSTRSALVQRDGDVVDLDGTSDLQFTDPGDDYFVAVRHRNHLGVMTLNVQTLSSTAAAIDFTDPSTLTFGTDAQKNVSGTMVMYNGNCIPDAQLKYTGAGNDRDPILVAIGGLVPTNTVNGYFSADINMDGEVKYTGAGNDRDLILVNIGGVVPTNTRDEQLP